MCLDLNSTVNHSVRTGARISGGMTPLILNREISRPGRDTHSAGRWVGPKADMGVWLKKRSFALLYAEPSLFCCPAYNLVTVSATLRRRPPYVPRLFAVTFGNFFGTTVLWIRLIHRRIRQALKNGTDIV